MATEKPDTRKQLVIRTDNSSQYISKKFREAIAILGPSMSSSGTTHHSKTVMLSHFIKHSRRSTCGHTSLQTTRMRKLSSQKHLMITIILGCILHLDTSHQMSSYNSRRRETNNDGSDTTKIHTKNVLILWDHSRFYSFSALWDGVFLLQILPKGKH